MSERLLETLGTLVSPGAVTHSGDCWHGIRYLFIAKTYMFIGNAQHFLSHPARQSDRDAVKRFSNFDDPPEMAPAPYDFVRYISRELYDSGPVATTVGRELFETVMCIPFPCERFLLIPVQRSSDTAMLFTELTITPTIPTYYPFR
jgi:hypothetical protein